MIGLLPAAGTAERWGGYLKELLPIGNRSWMLDNCIQTLEDIGCTRFVIVTNTEKIGAIATHVAKHMNRDIAYVLGGATMWDSILKALPYCHGDRVVMSMPDTVVDLAEPQKLLEAPISFGTFATNDPGRYSVYTEAGRFKKDSSLPKTYYLAWGVVSWTPGVTHIFQHRDFTDFDTAFNYVMDYAGFGFTPIRSYHDMATFDEYARFVGLSK